MTVPKRISDRCYTIEPERDRLGGVVPFRSSTGRELSRRSGGSVYLGTYYYNHVPAVGAGIVYLRADELESILSARETVEELTGYEPAGWTYAQLAREVTEWLEIKQSTFQRAKDLVQNWHYQKCIPYELENAGLYDMTAAYWQVVERVKSPVFLIDEHGAIKWQYIDGSQRLRWERMKEICKRHKKLRVAIVGVNAAGWSQGRTEFHGTEVYRNGELGTVKPLSGRLQPLSLLSVRVTYELTQMQSIASKSVYSNADCVVTEKPELRVWDSWNIQYGCKAAGKCQVNAVGSWSIGDKMTKTFHPGGYFLEKHSPRIATTFHAAALGN